MRTLAHVTFAVGYVALFVALLSNALLGGWRTSAGRLDTSLLLLLLILTPISALGASVTGALWHGYLLLVPYALLRLVRHFRPLSHVWTSCVVAGAGATAVAVLVLRDDPAHVITLLAGLAAGCTMLLVANVFFRESRAVQGVRRPRLAFAAAGALLLPQINFIAAAGTFSPAFAVASLPVARICTGLAFICFFLAFSPPRWLFRRWQGAEQADFLASTSKREPEERGRRAPEDLVRGVERAVGGALTLAVIRSSAEASDYIVRASTDPSLLGVRLHPGEGLVGRALERQTVVIGTPAECEAALAARAQALGQTVLVAPIASEDQIWGAVLVVHRRGALFPEDDAALMGELARTAAVALDHATLVADRRARERRAADRRVQEMESRVQLMLNSIKDYGMLLLDADGRVAGWQPGAEHLFGHTRQAIAGQSAAPLFQMTPEAFLDWLREARTQGHAEREGQCRRADNSTFTGVTMIRPLVEDAAGAAGFVAVSHDVTTRRTLEDRVRQGQKMEAIGRLAGGVAHDFNNLLMVILGHADWLERGLRNDPRCEEVAGIQQAAERAADLTRRLLAFSRRTVLEPSKIDLSQLVIELLPMLRRLIGEHIEIVDATGSRIPAVLGDVTQLQQVVLNLAVNGRDAMPAGGTLTIRTGDVWIDAASAGDRAGRYALLEVTDTGIGMDAATRELAFEPFFTTKDVGQGTGLGLSTVYGIVQQLGGRIHVESEPSRGTTFRLYFPEMGSVAAVAASLSSFESSFSTDTLM